MFKIPNTPYRVPTVTPSFTMHVMIFIMSHMHLTYILLSNIIEEKKNGPMLHRFQIKTYKIIKNQVLIIDNAQTVAISTQIINPIVRVLRTMYFGKKMLKWTLFMEPSIKIHAK